MTTSLLYTLPDAIPVPRIQISLRSGQNSRIYLLEDSTAALWAELCFWHEEFRAWVWLPDRLQEEIDAGQWDSALAQLQVKGLIDFAICVGGRS